MRFPSAMQITQQALKSTHTWFQFQPHPFRLLLYLEWLLLIFTGLLLLGGFGLGRSDLFGRPALSTAEIPGLIATLMLFALMGLRLPTGLRLARWLYTGLQLALLGWATHLLDWGLDYIAPLLIVVVLRSCFLFEQRGRWAIAGLITVIYAVSRLPLLLPLFSRSPDWLTLQPEPNPYIKVLPDQSLQINLPAAEASRSLEFLRNLFLQWLWGNSLLFVLGLILLLLLVNALVAERQGRRRLAAAHAQLYQYSLQIDDQSALQERTRIARELHDSLGHLLTAQSLQLQSAALLLTANPEEAKQLLTDSQRLGSNALKELRQTLLLLRSDPLQGEPLSAAIARLTADFQRSTGLRPACQLAIAPLPQRIQVAVYRIVEEALTNIQKHSQATQVSISLNLSATDSPSRLDPTRLVLEIIDDGRGFDLEANRTGFGLRGMEERASSLGGEFQLQSQPNRGCRIVVTFPLPGATE
ncbi:MAG: sensor histidine kinase [Elainella sp.]